jgi:hypothetical protein
MGLDYEHAGLDSAVHAFVLGADARLLLLEMLDECCSWRLLIAGLDSGLLAAPAGKTMLAKALAAESRCFFINVTASAIMSKWYGDANRFIRAIFTLAAKLEPAVIFIGARRLQHI